MPRRDDPTFDPNNPRSPVNSEAYLEARRWRGEYKAMCLSLVCDAAESYRAELSRSDQAHSGRLAQRADELANAIREAAEAVADGPITMQEIEQARRRLESRR